MTFLQFFAFVWSPLAVVNRSKSALKDSRDRICGGSFLFLGSIFASGAVTRHFKQKDRPVERKDTKNSFQNIIPCLLRFIHTISVFPPYSIMTLTRGTGQSVDLRHELDVSKEKQPQVEAPAMRQAENHLQKFTCISFALHICLITCQVLLYANSFAYLDLIRNLPIFIF